MSSEPWGSLVGVWMTGRPDWRWRWDLSHTRHKVIRVTPFQGLDGGMVSHRAHTMIVPINVSRMFVGLDASNIVGKDVVR